MRLTLCLFGSSGMKLGNRRNPRGKMWWDKYPEFNNHEHLAFRGRPVVAFNNDYLVMRTRPIRDR